MLGKIVNCVRIAGLKKGEHQRVYHHHESPITVRYGRLYRLMQQEGLGETEKAFTNAV